MNTLSCPKLCSSAVRLCVQAELAGLAERQAANKHKLEEYHHLKVILLCMASTYVMQSIADSASCQPLS